jgi:hypothetical protein
MKGAGAEKVIANLTGFLIRPEKCLLLHITTKSPPESSAGSTFF